MLLGLLLVCYCNATAMLLQCFWIATGCAKACPWQLSLVGRTCLMSAHVRATQKRSPKVPETCAAWEKEGRAGVEWVDEALFRMGGSSVARCGASPCRLWEGGVTAHTEAEEEEHLPRTEVGAWEKEGRAGVEWVDEALFRMGGSSVASVVRAVLLRVAFGRGAWPAGRELLWRDKSLHQKVEPLIPQFPEPTRRPPAPRSQCW